MKKNVASQSIGAQMVSATDGSAFTSTVTVYVTGDNGTQALGSVGSGVCTHEGNGYHSYAPAQAETNYDHIALTFVGSGAVPATVQLYTEFPQTGDAFARLGAPAGASVSADVAATKALLPTALVGGRMDASVGAMAANVMTAAAAAADLTTELQTGLATAASVAALNNLSAAQVNAEVVDAINVDTYAEPGQGAPAATASLAAKMNYLYKAWRNKKTQTSTAFNLFADDTTTVDQKSTVSDDGTTATRGEIASGP